MLPGVHLAAGLADHPEVERDDQAGLLGGGDELRRRDQPALGVLPADQRLEARDPTGIELDDRLVGDPELVALDRAAKVGLQPEATKDAGVHRLVKHHVMRFAQGLGPVHRRVGVAEHLDGTVIARVAGGDADARRGEDFMPSQQERQAQLLLNPVDHAERIADVADVVDQDREFIATEPGDGVAVTDAGLQPPADADQELVAGHVAEAVVDDLEPVEVEEEDGEPEPLRPPRPVHGAVEPVGEQGAVGQAGEDVVIGLVEELLLGGLARGDVFVGDDDPNAVNVAEPGDSHVEPVASGGGLAGILA